jgi:hypothetical protein
MSRTKLRIVWIGITGGHYVRHLMFGKLFQHPYSPHVAIVEILVDSAVRTAVWEVECQLVQHRCTRPLAAFNRYHWQTFLKLMGRDSVVGITLCALWAKVRTPVGDEIFCTRPDRPRCLPNHMYNWYRGYFPRVKRPGRGFAEVKRVELYFCSPSVLLWHIAGRTLPVTVRNLALF